MINHKNKIFAVYDYIKNTFNEENIGLNKIKIIKLSYISFGFYGALNEKKHLFDNKIEAWKFGPVIPDLYHNIDEKFDDLPNLQKEEKEAIDKVLKVYADKKFFDLVEYTHKIGTPWYKIYDECSNKEIPKEDIIKYYSRLFNITELMIESREVFERLSKT